MIFISSFHELDFVNHVVLRDIMINEVIILNFLFMNVARQTIIDKTLIKISNISTICFLFYLIHLFVYDTK